jgi:hypothetical protein
MKQSPHKAYLLLILAALPLAMSSTTLGEGLELKQQTKAR